MGWVGLGEFVIVMTQTQPDPLLKRNFITQPNPPTPKNRPNPAGWVGSGWQVGCTPLIIIPHLLKLYNVKILFMRQTKKSHTSWDLNLPYILPRKACQPLFSKPCNNLSQKSMTFTESPNHFVFFPLIILVA